MEAEHAGPASQCRMYCIVARDGRSAVVFRRGPSRRVLVLRWWLASDRIEAGQWFKGRIYERRCDLSPNGDVLIYFAARWTGPYQSWTAVSRTPYLTALMLWPKGDAWGGGGLLESHRTVLINHKPHELTPAPEHPVPRRVRVARIDGWGGHGEDNPIEAARREREGWRWIAQGSAEPYGSRKGFAWIMKTPEVTERDCPVPRSTLKLLRELKAIGQRDGPWYVEDFILRDGARETRHFVGASWADWQATGDLLLARDGCLYRLPYRVLADADQAEDAMAGAVLVADLNGLAFAPRAAPEWARKPL